MLDAVITLSKQDSALSRPCRCPRSNCCQFY
jgi:hypothetical protein